MPQEQAPDVDSSNLHIKIETEEGASNGDSKTNSLHLALVDVRLKRSLADSGLSNNSHTENVRLRQDLTGSGSSQNSEMESEYLCGYCNGVFHGHDALAAHECIKKSNVSVLYECQECKTLFDSFPTLTDHIKQHKQDAGMVSRDALQNALLQSTLSHDHSIQSVTRLQYRCSECDKFLCSKGSLVKHQHLHMGLKPYTCGFCSKSFSLKGNRDKHELIHGDVRPHVCEICDKSFTLKGNLQQHILTHTSLKMYRCHICGNEFTLKGNLNKHLLRHKQGLGSQVKKRKQGDDVDIVKFKETESFAADNVEGIQHDKLKESESVNVKEIIVTPLQDESVEKCMQDSSMQTVDDNEFGVTGNESDTDSVDSMNKENDESVSEADDKKEDSQEAEIQNY